MGSVCCVAAKNRNIPNNGGSGTLHSNSVYSPSWSLRWENRRRVAGEVDNYLCQHSRGITSNSSREIKGSEIGSERVVVSDVESPLESFGTPMSQKSTFYDGRNPTSDLSIASNYSTEVKHITDSPETTEPKHSFSTPSTPSLSTPRADPLPSSSQTHPLPINSTPSRRARRSPGHQLFRQISDSQILGLKSPNNNTTSEGRPSFALSSYSNEITSGSQFGSSDGWSLRTFSELVASSQRERWSFDSEQLGSSRGRLSYSYATTSTGVQTCGVCSKLLTERSSWSSQKLFPTCELSVVAILACGHVYHSECLETMTVEADRFDPNCPVCLVGEKQLLKMSKKASRATVELKARNNNNSKISRNRIVDSYCEGDFEFLDQSTEKYNGKGKGVKLEPSSSTGGRSLAKPFLRWHFPTGPKWNRSLSDNDSSRKKGFWMRYRKN